MGRKERREEARRIAKEWAPPRVGPKKDDEEVCYAFAIPNLPLIPDKETLAFLKHVQTFDGFLGFYPNNPYGTVIIFDTENNAKGGRNLIRIYPGVEFPIGEIGEVFVNKKYLRGQK